MPTYVVFCYVNSDGVGDFTHYADIMQKLERYQVIQWVSVILFSARGKDDNYLRIQDKLRDNKGIVYYGKDDEHRDIFTQDTLLIEHLNHAEQAFCISYEGNLMSLYASYLKPNIPVKYIGEHGVVLYAEALGSEEKSPYHVNRSLGLSETDYYGNPCQGIKLLDLPLEASFQTQWAHIAAADPAFSARVLACTDSLDATVLQHHHVFMAAYFNHGCDFFEFLSQYPLGFSRLLGAVAKSNHSAYKGAFLSYTYPCFREIPEQSSDQKNGFNLLKSELAKAQSGDATAFLNAPLIFPWETSTEGMSNAEIITALMVEEAPRDDFECLLRGGFFQVKCRVGIQAKDFITQNTRSLAYVRYRMTPLCQIRLKLCRY
ncbi:MAG: hypothetical protein K0U24_02310 [Gammaproteobacteria bacterium]|nr:hypothetical protein [Gammaproteobacteria bacterium]MCH9717467.1 hypothetical protein [Gammaproteobacteria bacterium]MCH9763055.1 hypothetical protein [Gammaproteobacteria bacterium]